MLHRFLPAPVRSTGRRLLDRLRPPPPERSAATESFSQQGEDTVLLSYFQHRPAGFYVDVGAHHPWRFSNTFAFYRRGWRGLNVDATPGSMDAFRRHRPRDVNVEAAVGSRPDAVTFFEFAEPAFNALALTADQVASVGQRSPLVRTSQVVAVPLGRLLAEHLPPGQAIDFLTIDVEGLEIDILSTNDWDRHRPTVIVAEDLGAFDVPTVLSRPLSRYLGEVGYRLCGKSHHTLFFVEASRYDAGGLR